MHGSQMTWNTVDTFVAGLKIIAHKIEALESAGFGNRLNEKLLMAKILGCLPKDFNSFITSWSLLTEEMFLESLEKLINAERNIAEHVAVDATFKSQSKSTDGQTMKAVEKKI